MADELEKTCENCKYEYEDMEGTHCRHCIHNAIEHFEPKEVELSEKEIRAKVIDEFTKEIRDWQIDIQDNEYDADKFDFVFERIFEIAEELKAGGNNEQNI